MKPIVGIIVAMTSERVIGVNGTIPWKYPEDLKRFKEITTNKTVIMGRLTWESLPKKPLPNRRNIVLSRHDYNISGAEVFGNLEAAIAASDTDTWIIGGGSVYAEVLQSPSLIDVIDVTYIPVHVDTINATYFPEIDLNVWKEGELLVSIWDSVLTRCTYTRK